MTSEVYINNNPNKNINTEYNYENNHEFNNKEYIGNHILKTQNLPKAPNYFSSDKDSTNNNDSISF